MELFSQIVAYLGPPPEGTFPNQTFNFKPSRCKLRDLFPREQAIQTSGYYLSNTGCDLLRSFLDYDPKTRINADQALRHSYVYRSSARISIDTTVHYSSLFLSFPFIYRYFEEAPKPRQIEFMPTFASTNDGREVRSGALDVGVFQR